MKKLKINNSMKPYFKNITPFKYLSDIEQDFLMSLSTVYQFEDQEVIIRQGEFDQSLFAVLKGSVKVTVDNEQEDAYICTLGTSEIFGEAGMFMNAERTANVISLDKAIIIKITRVNMLKFVQKHPNASNKIFMIMIYSLLQKLKEANRELAYERKSDFDQNDIDNLIAGLIDPQE